MYLPIFYYPIQEDDRATGFLIPTYGTSTVRGQSLSNAFFWAIGRSQDATLYHDWFSKTGQGVRRRVPLRADAGLPGQRARVRARRARRDGDATAGPDAADRREAELSGHGRR